MQGKTLVTGGSGFVGGALVDALVGQGRDVISISRKPPRSQSPLVRHNLVDLQNVALEQLLPLLEGVETVFHTAAKVEMWGKFEDFYRINFLATQKLLQACRTAGVKRFIYTSSPSVISRPYDLNNVNETIGYPDKFLAFYPATKAMAEREVLQQHSINIGGDGFFTISLRPHLIFGPDDRHLVPTVVARARAGRLVQIGNGENLVDFTYISDCVQAHLDAESALGHDPSVGGQAYFVSQGEPVYLWWWIGEILKGTGSPKVNRKIPRQVAYMLAQLLELAAKVIRKEPLFTRFLVEQMAYSHYFDISKARENLGFSPQVSVKEGIEKTVSAYRP